MGTNAPQSRKTHITRVFGTNRDGEILSELWADVERMDIVKSALQVPPLLQWQGVQRQLLWCDDPNGDGYSEDGTPSRITEVVKVCDPETQDVNDPDEWIPLRVIKGLRARVETGRDINGGTAMDRFISIVTDQELNSAREIEVRKIVHYDTNIDDDAQAAADSGLKEYVVAPANYEKDTGSKDDTQHVDHEIITLLKHKGNIDELAGLGGQTKLLNQYLIDESEEPDGTVTGSAGYNPPYRLDPFQNIINIQLSPGDQQWVLGIAKEVLSFSVPYPLAHHAEAKDGTGFGPRRGGASGLGFTIVTNGCVAFGKVKTPDGTKRAFLRADAAGGAVYLGTIGVGGGLQWQNVWTAPGDILSISYANDAFFVSYTTDVIASVHATASRLAVTRDGSNFSEGINPWPAEISMFGGSVAFLDDGSGKHTGIYVTTNSTPVDQDSDLATDNLVWSVSNNGLSWSGGIASGVGGSGAETDSQLFFTNIAAGNGVFVAAAGKKHTFTLGTGDNVVVHGCAVAVSTNGTGWSAHEMPGAIVDPGVNDGIPENFISSRGGDCLSVAFIRDKKFVQDAGQPGEQTGGGTKKTGYFVAVGYEAGGFNFDHTITPAPKLKMWISIDGSSWSLIRTEDAVIGESVTYDTLTAIDKDLSKSTLVTF